MRGSHQYSLGCDKIDKQWYIPSSVNDDLSRICHARTVQLAFQKPDLPLQVLSSVSFHPFGHSFRHSPVAAFLTYRHALQFVASGVLLEVPRHPILLKTDKYFCLLYTSPSPRDA